MELVRWSPFCLVVLSAISLVGRTARASVYVVDQAAPGAADTNAGTEESPFKTIQRAADVAKPGDTVYVMAGRYEERVKVKTSGAEGQADHVPGDAAAVGHRERVRSAGESHPRGRLRDHGREAGRRRCNWAGVTARCWTTTSTT